MAEYILVLNGPNLNLLGAREPSVYGRNPLPCVIAGLNSLYDGVIDIVDFQSNHEGELIDRLHKAGFDPECRGIVFNAGAYTHTSLALADAIRAIPAPVVEVHISNVAARESMRHVSLIAPACLGTITGFGTDVYRLGVNALLHRDD